MDMHQSSFQYSLLKSKFRVWNKFMGTCAVFLLLSSRVSSTNNLEFDEYRGARQSRDMYYGLKPSPITRIHRVSNGRLNSRFLTTIPSLEFLHFARREGQLMPEHAHVPSSPYYRQYSRHAGNSPVYYIRLPPAPYMFVPGLGYVSPHPYNTPMIPSRPVMMNPLGMMMADDGGSGSMEEDLSSAENMQNNVISLPLKFLSNGRPAQIQNPKKKKPSPSKLNSLKQNSSSKTTNLISGGKYSFNGRPNGVFIVNSPVMDSTASSLQHHNNAIL